MHGYLINHNPKFRSSTRHSKCHTGPFALIYMCYLRDASQSVIYMEWLHEMSTNDAAFGTEHPYKTLPVTRIRLKFIGVDKEKRRRERANV